MTRLLYVCNIPGFFVNQRLHVARAAREAGYEVHIATAETGPESRIIDEGFRFHGIEFDRKGLVPWTEAATIKALFDLYDELRPDLVENSTIKPVIYGGLAAHWLAEIAIVNWITGLGYVFTDSGLKGKLLRTGVEAGYRLALRHRRSTTIFKNPDDRDLFVDSGLVPRERTTVIRGAGVDVERYAPDRSNGSEVPIIVMACRMLWPKGVEEFVRAARQLRKTGIQARFALVGDCDPGNPQSISRARLQAWDEEGDVEWWGYREDMPEVLRQASVFCLPSYYREGVPKALLEAAASGLPLVTTDAPGCRETVDGSNGILVSPKDANALAEALGILLGDSDLRRRMGQRSRELAETRFSEERIAEMTLSVYAKTLERPA